jgi:hypothetical protein
VRVAEQVSIERPPDVVVALLGRRPDTWLQPFVLLAWNEGQAAQRRLGGTLEATVAAPAGNGKAEHQLRLGEPATRPAGVTAFGLLWTVDAPRGLFRRMRGDLVVEPFEAGTVLGLRATCIADGEQALVGTAQRPVELVVRSLLGHIRTAVE